MKNSCHQWNKVWWTVQNQVMRPHLMQITGMIRISFHLDLLYWENHFLPRWYAHHKSIKPLFSMDTIAYHTILQDIQANPLSLTKDRHRGYWTRSKWWKRIRYKLIWHHLWICITESSCSEEKNTPISDISVIIFIIYPDKDGIIALTSTFIMFSIISWDISRESKDLFIGHRCLHSLGIISLAIYPKKSHFLSLS